MVPNRNAQQKAGSLICHIPVLDHQQAPLICSTDNKTQKETLKKAEQQKESNSSGKKKQFKVNKFQPFNPNR